MKLKIRSKVDPADLVDDEEMLMDFINKTFLKFFIGIYRHSKNSEDWHALVRLHRDVPVALPGGQVPRIPNRLP